MINLDLPMHLSSLGSSGGCQSFVFLDFVWQQINKKPQVIEEHEAGKVIPNNQIITKLECVLGVRVFIGSLEEQDICDHVSCVRVVSLNYKFVNFFL